MEARDFLRPSDWFKDSSGPRYVQLRRRLEDGIRSGVLEPNALLPSEREMAEITDFSRVTIRKAMQELVHEGIVEQRQGSGSFVRAQPPRLEQSLSQLTSFSEDMKRRGLTTASKWLERGVFMPSPDEMVALGLSADAQVSRIYRLRQADGQPLALERASLPRDILPNPTDVEGSLYAFLGRTGARPVRAIQRISAVNLDTREAGLLDLPEGAAGLSIQRLSYLQSGRVAELTQSLYRGDAYDFVAELRISN
ncbi:MAG: GntR family transcriptional regulator [Pseudomonadota bacterium]